MPVREGLAAFGEIGLTGRLRQPSQVDRRLDECAKFGIAEVVAPAGAAERTGVRVVSAETLRAAITAGLERERARRGGCCVAPEGVAVPLIACEEHAMMCVDAGRERRCRHFFVKATDTDIGEALLFDIGDKVVYPHHGAGTVVRKEKREVLGEVKEYLTIQILHNDMTVNVPCENAERVGLRTVIDQRTVVMVVRTLSGGSTEMPKNWNRRFKHNRDKMKTGNIFELAEVVRNLAVRNNEKGLSTGEKQMFVKAKKILASELMYAKDMNEDEAATWLDEVLSRAGQPKPKSRAKPKAATASA